MNRTTPVAMKQALGEEQESRRRRRRLPPSPQRRAEMGKKRILLHSVSTATQHGLAQARLPALTRLAHSRRFQVLEKKVKTDAFALRFDCRSAVHKSRSGVVLQCTRIPCTTVPLHYTSPDMACACTQARARRRRRPAKVTCVSVGRCRKLGSLLYAYTFACSYTYNT